jgi:hypothetical protein
MAKKSTAKLHKGKKLEEQKPLRANHSDYSVVKHIDVATP